MPRNQSEKGPYVVAKRSTVFHEGLRMWVWLVHHPSTDGWFIYYQASQLHDSCIAKRRFSMKEFAVEKFKSLERLVTWSDLGGSRQGSYTYGVDLDVDFLDFDGRRPTEEVYGAPASL